MYLVLKMVETISYKPSKFTYNFRLESTSREVIDEVKLHILDTLVIMMITYNLGDVKRVVNVARFLAAYLKTLLLAKYYIVLS